MGCVRRLILLALLIAAIAAGWWLRDRWTKSADRADRAEREELWQPLTPEGAARARRAVQELEGSSGPVFVNVRGADLSSYVYEELAAQLPPSAEDVHSAVIGERLYLRATVRLSELGGRGVLGPLAGLLGERDTVQFGGRFDVIRPGLAQFLVDDIRVREFPVPSRLIDRLIGEIRRGAPVEGLAPNGLPLEVPSYIGDVRIADRRITLYRAAQ